MTGRIGLVTGGASGIGLATARALAADDVLVYLGARDLRRAELAVADARHSGLVLRAVHLDVRDAQSVARAMSEIAGDRGGIDILVNNAGVDCRGRIESLSEDDWDQCLDTNLKGAYLCSRAALPLLRRAGGGSIVNVASNAGLVARADEPAYSVSKAGLIMLTRSLALAHAVDRVRVNAVCPGPVGDTDIMDRNIDRATDPDAAIAGYLAKAPMAQALGRLIRPDEVAQLIRYLCSEAAEMVTGATIAIDGGKGASGPQ